MSKGQDIRYGERTGVTPRLNVSLIVKSKLGPLWDHLGTTIRYWSRRGTTYWERIGANHTRGRILVIQLRRTLGTRGPGTFFSQSTGRTGVLLEIMKRLEYQTRLTRRATSRPDTLNNQISTQGLD